jgi:predicted dehydrogenase
MEIPREEAYAKELDVRMSMSYGPGRYDPEYEERGQDYPYAYVRYTEQRNMRAFLEAVADKRVSLGPLITHRFPIERALEAYASFEGGEPYLGILLNYGETPSERTLPRAPAAAPEGMVALEKVTGRVGLGVLGAGNYVRGVLLPALRGLGVDRVGIVTRTGASAEQAARATGFRWSGTRTERLLEDPAIDAVIIGTRHRLHAEQVIAVLRAGKHVFVEKPLCLSEDELAEIAQLQQTTRCYVQVGTNRRFSPYTAEIRRAFAGRADPIALTCRINAGRLPASHWLRDPKEGGGRLVGEGIHFVDWCHAVVGVPIRRVQAVQMGAGPTSLPGDTFAISLSFSDGSLAQVLYAADGDRGLGKERYEVYGLARVAIIDDWRGGRLHREGRQRAFKLGRGQKKGVREQLQAFLGALRTGRPAVPLDVAWHVQHATLAAAASLTDGLPREVAWPRPEFDEGEAHSPNVAP